MEITHIAIWVSDLNIIKDFYIDTLGLEKRWETIDDQNVHNLYIGGSGETEIQFKYDPNNEQEVHPKTIDHLAVEVDDIDSCFARLLDKSQRDPILKPAAVDSRRGYDAKIALIEDPEGYTLELVQNLE